MTEKILQLLIFLVGGIVISYIINVLLLRFSESLGIRNKNDVVVRWSNQSKPSLGGISFFVVFLFSAIAFSIIFSADKSIFQNAQYIGLFIAGSMAFLMGLADDAYNTKPLIKLAIQISCGIVFIATGSVIHLTGNEWINYVITIFWVIAVMNSLNMLDNMDGITGTVVVFILIACLSSSYFLLEFNRNIWSILLVSQIGALLGFLKLNVHPSKLFMGDAGSQFISLFVSFFAIHFLWNAGYNPLEPGVSSSWPGMLICLVAFTPPAVDTLTVVINRLRKGKSPMVGGKDHTTHHLVYAGLNDKKVWYVFLILSLISLILSSIMVYCIIIQVLWPIAVMSLFFVIVFVVLFRLTQKYAHKEK